MYVNTFAPARRAHPRDATARLLRRRRHASARAARSPTNRSTTSSSTRPRRRDVRARAPRTRQPWEFVVVRDPAIRAAIGDLTQQAWEARRPRLRRRPRSTPKLFADVDAGATGGVAAAPGADRRVRRHTNAASRHARRRRSSRRCRTCSSRATRSASAARSPRSPRVLGDELRELLGLPDHVAPGRGRAARLPGPATRPAPPRARSPRHDAPRALRHARGEPS